MARSAHAAGGKGWEVVFHKGQSEVGRPEAVMIAAGAAHSSAVTRDGVVLAWRSMDPALQPQEVGGPLAGKSVTAISAGEGSPFFQGRRVGGQFWCSIYNKLFEPYPVESAGSFPATPKLMSQRLGWIQ